MLTMEALRVEQLSVRRGSTLAVRGVDLTVGAGELVTVVGPNGAGKSSLLRALAGLEKAVSGTASYGSHRVRFGHPGTAARAGIALVPEGRRIFAPLTVRENLVLGATLRTPAETSDGIARWTDRFPVLAHRLDSPAGSLSGGEQQMLAIARALMARPTLLLLDEPSLGLAPQVLDGVFEALGELHEDGLAILLVEQAARRAIAMADRVYVMAGGVIRAEGTAADFDGESLTDAYFGAAS
jgi:branched-chain amino acid transport system ATP-binding protein